jgi:hypothetical protein
MLKKLLIPCFIFAASVAIGSGGCGSSSSSTGTGGKGGSAAGSTGSAGAAAGSTGSAGAAAGSTGSAGGTAGASGGTTGTAGSTTDGGGTAGAAAGSDGGGTAGAAAGSDGGGADMSTDTAVTLPTCTSTTADSAAMSAMNFCEIFLADCGTTHAGYGSMAACLTTYGANSATLIKCQSYHVCNANGFAAGSTDRTTHCTHAGTDPGNGVCTP